MTATVANYQEGQNQFFNQGLFEVSATAKHRLGTIRRLDDGRKYVYCGNTAAALAAGITISKAQAPQLCTVAAADAAINLAGVKTVTYTLSGTPTKNLYQDGFLVVTAGDGLGEMYKIRGNTADDDPASGRCTFYLYDALQTLQVTATTTVSAWENPYSNLLITPATANGAATTQETVMGVTTRIIVASQYFWAQTWGLGNLMLDIDAAAGAEANEMSIILGTTTGRGLVLVTTAMPGMQILGYTLESADLTDATGNLVNLLIS